MVNPLDQWKDEFVDFDDFWDSFDKDWDIGSAKSDIMIEEENIESDHFTYSRGHYTKYAGTDYTLYGTFTFNGRIFMPEYLIGGQADKELASDFGNVDEWPPIIKEYIYEQMKEESGGTRFCLNDKTTEAEIHVKAERDPEDNNYVLATVKIDLICYGGREYIRLSGE